MAPEACPDPSQEYQLPLLEFQQEHSGDNDHRNWREFDRTLFPTNHFLNTDPETGDPGSGNSDETLQGEALVPKNKNVHGGIVSSPACGGNIHALSV